MKIIFLDVDGVLNGIEYVKANQNGGIVLDPSRMERLKQIVDATDAKIVLSTSWRSYWSSNRDECRSRGQEINMIFAKYRLEIYEKTPWMTDRDKEIISFLYDYPVEEFVILDDRAVHTPSLALHQVLTLDSLGGLTDEDVTKAIDILKSNRQNAL
ncbi:MAG: hypothetical protein IKT34_00900 [Clostridia bacterium]|nr:hypothetical protein [Clostridia bacterium]